MGEPFDPEPATLADLKDYGVYTLKQAARLLRTHPETLIRGGIKTLPRKFRNSRLLVLGKDILIYVGVQEIERAGRTSEGNETQAEREKRVVEALIRMGIKKHPLLPVKPKEKGKKA